MMKRFGIIGYPLTHSFSPQYFAEKFERLGIDAQYQKFEMPEQPTVTTLFEQYPDLIGINVTIPHKVAVMDQLDAIDPAAAQIGAVNVIKRLPNQQLKGYNTDYYGFKKSLENFLPPHFKSKALILGTGGASKAVSVALQHLGIEFRYVSRRKQVGQLTYQSPELQEALAQHWLVINCTPLGTHPNIYQMPPLPYQNLTAQHLLYDLVYNPTTTAFMKKAIAAGAKAKNGLEMLHLQAEEAWQIWNHV